MGTTIVDITHTFKAPIQAVFDRLTDHESMKNWPGTKDCQVISPGVPAPNGLGAVRRIKVGGLTLDERVVSWDPPNGFDYTIIRGLPVKHLGQVRLSEDENGVHASWHIELTSRVPLLTRIVGGQLQKGLPRALTWIDDQL